MPLLAIVRLKGIYGLHPDVKKTLQLLRLHKVNHAVLYPDTPAIRGMLQKVKDTIAWGEIERNTLIQLLKKRGRLPGNKRITEEYLKSLGKTIEEIADEIMNGKKPQDFGIKPVFRLRPTRVDKKRPFKLGGSLGYHGKHINELLREMI